jgi:chromosome segregation ATPase
MKIPDYEARLGVSKRELDRANQEMENWKFKAQKLEENLEQIGRENQDLHRGLLHKSQENENLRMSHTQLELMKNRQGQMEAASQSTIEQLRNRLRTLE